MRYVRIINENECPIEGITKLGISTARGNVDKIGQFGSGVKMGVLCLLRHGIKPTIYSGTTKIEYQFEKSELDGQTYHPVYIAIDNKKPQETSLTLEYGAIDWTSPDMGMREFVSNAIDQGKYKIDIVNNMRGKNGHTTIFVPCVDEVEDYVNQLAYRFLHFNVLVENTPNMVLGKIQPNTPAKAFRKGVFVRDFGKNSLFDYNFDESLEIDDCRNSDVWRCECLAAKMLANSVRHIPRLIKSIINDEQKAERSFPISVFEREVCNKDELRSQWLEMWRNNFGNTVIVSNCANVAIIEQVEKKGYKMICIPDTAWFDLLEKIGIPTYMSVDSGVGPKNTIFSDVIPEETTQLFDQIWSTLKNANLTFNAEKPNFRLYSQYMDGGGVTMGFYISETKTVCINEDNQQNAQTYLEEFAHHITGSTDFSRDFQDFAFRIAAKFMNIL